jgi:hypothetical protein
MFNLAADFHENTFYRLPCEIMEFPVVVYWDKLTFFDRFAVVAKKYRK